MFKNLKAEMARNGHKNADAAQILGISRQAYEWKMKTGKFKVTEAKKLCALYSLDFDYLFETETEPSGEEVNGSMERDVLPEDCERINIVLEGQGNEAQRREVRRMLENALEAVRQAGVDVCGSVMTQTAQGISCIRIDIGK